MVSTASTNALPMNCPWRNKLSPSPRPRRGVHIVKVCPVDNIYLLCYTATCLSSIAGAGYSSPFPSHQRVHTRWFGRALEWHSRGSRFDPDHLHHKSPVLTLVGAGFFYLYRKRGLSPDEGESSCFLPGHSGRRSRRMVISTSASRATAEPE